MAQSFEFTGKVKAISQIETGVKNDKTWEKQTIVIEENNEEQHKAGIVIEAFNKPDECKKCVVGAVVKAFYNPQANEWQGRYFQKNGLWKIEVLQSFSLSPQFDVTKDYGSGDTGGDGDLPF